MESEIKFKIKLYQIKFYLMRNQIKKIYNHFKKISMNIMKTKNKKSIKIMM